MLRVAFFLFTFSFFCKFNDISGDCVTDKDCVFHDWMSWQDCSGQCGNQTQIRQRVFCCPRKVQEKNRENCLRACNMALSQSNKFDESRPCRVCDEGHLVAASNTCVCNHGYRGPCCGGRPFLSFQLVLKLFENLLWKSNQYHSFRLKKIWKRDFESCLGLWHQLSTN